MVLYLHEQVRVSYLRRFPYLEARADNWTAGTADVQPAHPMSATGFYLTAETGNAVENHGFQISHMMPKQQDQEKVF